MAEEHAKNSISFSFLSGCIKKLSCVIIMCGGNNNNNNNSNIPISITFLQTLMNILYSLWIIEIICINIVKRYWEWINIFTFIPRLIICFTNRYIIPIYVFSACIAFVYLNQVDDVQRHVLHHGAWIRNVCCDIFWAEY